MSNPYSGTSGSGTTVSFDDDSHNVSGDGDGDSIGMDNDLVLVEESKEIEVDQGMFTPDTPATLGGFTPANQSMGGITPANQYGYGNETPADYNNNRGLSSSNHNNVDYASNSNARRKMEIRIPKVEIIDSKDDSLSLLLTNCDLSFANALRRICIAEVPTLAIDFVDVTENSSVLDDEFVAHRLGLVPLYSREVDSFRYARDCDCEDGCCFCEIQFECNIHNQGNETILVTQRDLINMTRMPLETEAYAKLTQLNNCRKVTPVTEKSAMVGGGSSDQQMNGNGDNNEQQATHDDIILVKLGSNQRLKFVAKARKGIGKLHAKYTPVSVVAFSQTPFIAFDEALLMNLSGEQKKAIADSCPRKCYSYDDNTEEIEIENPKLCTFCGECESVAESIDNRDLIEIHGIPHEFRLEVETTGSLTPAKIIEMAFDILQQKIVAFRDNLKQLPSTR